MADNNDSTEVLIFNPSVFDDSYYNINSNDDFNSKNNSHFNESMDEKVDYNDNDYQNKPTKEQTNFIIKPINIDFSDSPNIYKKESSSNIPSNNSDNKEILSNKDKTKMKLKKT